MPKDAERPIVGTEQCPCAYLRCPRYFLTNLGTFYQGTGFTEAQAKRIAELVNNDPEFPFEEYD